MRNVMGPLMGLSRREGMGRMTHHAIAGAAWALVLAGCTVGPEYTPPVARLPEDYQSKIPLAENGPGATLARWWRHFEDPRLDALIVQASQANLDVRLARARVREARALAGVAGARRYPSVDASGQYTRSRLSENAPIGHIVHSAGQPVEGNLFTAGLDASWEIDVFGGTRRTVEAASADTESEEEAARQVRVTVLAEVGLNYLHLRGLQKRLDVAKSNLRTQQETLALAADRFQAGLVSDLDPARARAQMEETRSLLPGLERDIERAIYRLAVLLGKAPEEIDAGLRDVRPIPGAPPEIPPGLPSDLLRRRPDLRRAEREVAAATARVGEATADLYPRFFLTGSGGLQSIKATDFLRGASQFWSVGPSVTWPIFAGGRIRSNIEAQDARQEQALLRFQQTVLQSLEEVENALVGYAREQDHFRALAASETAARRSAEVADQQYRAGVADFLSVLDAERSLLGVQDELAGSEETLGQDLILLYKALGGGWED